MLVPVKITFGTAQVIVPAWAILMFGTVVFCITVNTVFVLQPFAELVAVAVYVLGLLIVKGLATFTKVVLFHTILLPALIAVSVAFVLVQFKLLLAFAVKSGAVVFCVTVNTVLDLHPFAPLVAVAVYVFGVLIVKGLATFTNVELFHTILLPALMAVRVALVFVQFKLLLALVVRAGVVVFCATVTIDDELQPVKVLVMVNV